MTFEEFQKLEQENKILILPVARDAIVWTWDLTCNFDNDVVDDCGNSVPCYVCPKRIVMTRSTVFQPDMLTDWGEYWFATEDEARSYGEAYLKKAIKTPIDE